jgi:hypothetical protein
VLAHVAEWILRARDHLDIHFLPLAPSCQRSWLGLNVIAGMIVWLLVIPEAVAYAQIDDWSIAIWPVGAKKSKTKQLRNMTGIGALGGGI